MGLKYMGILDDLNLIFIIEMPIVLLYFYTQLMNKYDTFLTILLLLLLLRYN